ncbi:MAG: ATP-binding protein [Lentisphaerae bacterium]|jgi:predicted AAA+ superfamily ATPase|nr:ATP-binding protein [Lentisphaerota bacterium]
MNYERPLVDVLRKALDKRPGVMHVVVGPRQVGKTTAVRQVCGHLDYPSHWASADAPVPPGAEWIESHWRLAGTDAARSGKPVLLVLDEIQKVRGWSETVKRLWDETLATGVPLRVVLLGSSALLVQAGLTESLTGRFFLHRCMHWGWPECRTAFGWDLDDWLYFGGYPGAAAFADDEQAWRQYVSDAMVETVLSRDVFQLSNITKPVLMRHLFGLAAQYPAQIVSYTKLMGQLQDAGNTTTLAHYLRLLESAFLVSGLEQYSAGQIRKRGSSPKLVFWNNALIHAMSGRTRRTTFGDGAWMGRIVENAIGAQLLNRLQGAEWSVTYWRDGNKEVDFVVRRGSRLWGIEIKSGRPGKLSGMEAFRRRYPKAGAWLIGAEGIALETFFARDPATFFE